MNPSALPLQARLRWTADLRFEAENDAGARFSLDGDGRAGLSPMEALLVGLGGCMGADVVAILKKMRVDLDRLRITLAGDRHHRSPKFFQRVVLRFEVPEAVPEDKLERAIALSRETYCSVLHSLRPDMTLEVEIARS